MTRAIFLLAAVQLLGSEADRAVLSAMRMSAPDVCCIHTLRREPVDKDLDLVLAIGTPKAWGPIKAGGAAYWGYQTPLGIFLQSRDRPGTVYKISVSQNSEDCEVNVEHLTATDAVLSCTPDKGGPGPNHKFVYDLHLKSLVKEFTYPQFGLQRIFASDASAVLVGTNSQRQIAIKYSPGDDPSFRILHSADVPLEAKTLPRFGPDNRFSLVKGAKGLLVVERTANVTKRYPFPQTSYDEFARLRPNVANGNTRRGTMIEETIGPWQMVDGTLWFAKNFYDAEGNSGVGGVGFFDTAQRKYQICAPPELVDFAATAILVEPEAVWLGLAVNGEYGTVGAGLLRFDRATQTAQKFGFRGIVNAIVRVGNKLLLATDTGAVVLDNGTIHRFFVDETAARKLELTESLLPPQR